MSKYNVIFMGTPDFSEHILEQLINVVDLNILGVVTQPDRPVGRKRELKPTPVKVIAAEHGIDIYQPEKLTGSETEEWIISNDVDLIITAAYGQLVPESILNHPKYGCINVHASLLPKYRGGAPIHHAIMNGEPKTGITLMYMDKALDSGDIIRKEEVLISDDTTVAEMFDTLKVVGANLLVDTLPLIFNEMNERVAQNHKQATYAPNITKDDERINFEMTAREVHNHIRGMNSWPVAHTLIDGTRLKIYRSKVSEQTIEFSQQNVPGMVEIKDDQFFVQCGQSTVIELIEVQLAGKKRMSIKQFLQLKVAKDLSGKVLGGSL